MMQCFWARGQMWSLLKGAPYFKLVYGSGEIFRIYETNNEAKSQITVWGFNMLDRNKRIMCGHQPCEPWWLRSRRCGQNTWTTQQKQVQLMVCGGEHIGPGASNTHVALLSFCGSFAGILQRCKKKKSRSQWLLEPGQQEHRPVPPLHRKSSSARLWIDALFVNL